MVNARIVASASAGMPRNVRRVYIDAGTNWGDTLDLYRKLAAPQHRNATNWEIYSFEASPPMAGFLHRLAQWKNGFTATRPVSCMPMDSGGSEGRLRYAPIVACGRRWQPKMNSCMSKVFLNVSKSFVVNHSLLEMAHVQRQLDVAAKPHSASNDHHRPRYTFIPAAVSASDVRVKFNNQIPGYPVAGPRAKVYAVDFPRWIARHFRTDDYLVLKMDIEGYEHSVLHELLRQSSGALIDQLAWECHPTGRPACTRLGKTLTTHGVAWMSDRAYERLGASKEEWRERVATLRKCEGEGVRPPSSHPASCCQ